MAWEPDYVTTAEFKTYARITDAAEDALIARDITAASRAVDRYCSQHVPRQFGLVAAPEARYYTPRWDRDQIRWVVEIDDLELANIAGLEILVDTTNTDTYTEEITEYVLRPKNAPQKNRPYTQIAILSDEPNQPTFFQDGLKITGQWGWTTPPTTVKDVTLLQTLRVRKRRTAPFGVTGSAKRGTQVTTNLVEELDAEFETLLQSYVKMGWTVGS